VISNPHIFLSLFSIVFSAIKDLMEGLAVESGATGSEEGTAPVLPSSIDLFYMFRNSLDRCLKLTNKKPLLDLAKVFAKHLASYAELLISHLPK
jgi:hypothetical protein